MKNAGVWAGIVLLIFASVIFWQSLSLDYYTPMGPGPGLFPSWLSIILIILSLLYIWESVKKEVVYLSEILPKGKALMNVLATLGGVLGFMLLLPFAGFVTSGAFLLLIMLIREYKWYVAIGWSLGMPFVLFVVFEKFLGIPLPVNMFGW